ncbi:hypothetical protein [Brevibacillus parabrevis]|uniref:hypothetical protein n=1 Tax=Brevibacillus parabrevis TaxID=54914 RepID=UPI001C2237F4|nr:hypothetical protein [Brevibacillus parabrevis]MBU8713930.1 hypothetical protein [Brevibacillus parabrevis]MDR4998339.1 hypothetical protein [Brevibacillus parabrevis]
MKNNWKNWVIFLSLSLPLFSVGCTMPAKEESKSKTKAQNKPVKLSAIQKLGDNKMDVVLFLNRAEHVLEEVYFAALDNAKGKTVYEDGLVFRELPKQFESKDKIVGYFGRYWSMPLALSMYDKLTTKLIKDKVFVAVPRVDYPVLISVRNTTVAKSNGELDVTVQDATDSSFASDRTLRYRLVRDQKTKRFEIKARSGAYGSEQFQ